MIKPDQLASLRAGITYVLRSYQPKFNDGTPWSVMKPVKSEELHGGRSVTTSIVQFRYEEKPPLEPQKLYAQQLCEQLTHLQEDGRTCVQMLLDSGATAWELVDKDDDDVDIITVPPSISAVVSLATGERGRIFVEYLRVLDSYRLRFQPLTSGESYDLAKHLADANGDQYQEHLYFDDLPVFLAHVLGDACRQSISIEPVGSSPKNVMAAKQVQLV